MKKPKFDKSNKLDGKKKLEDEEIPSSDEELMEQEDQGLLFDGEGARRTTGPTAADEEEEGEQQYEDSSTLALREAKRLLDAVEAKESAAITFEEEEAAEADRLELEAEAATTVGLLKERQQKDLAKAQRKLADHVRFDMGQPLISYRPHRFSPICLCFSNKGNFLVSCSKDGSVVKYDLAKCCRVGMLKAKRGKKKDRSVKKTPNHQNTATTNTDNFHKGSVLCCAISPDDKYLVTGGSDRLIKIWDFATLLFIREFDGHRGPITSLRFRRQTEALEMFSSSTDRSIMVWNMDELGLMNTLYGHQDAIEQLDILQWPRVISCGGMDKSCRLFKILEESHLVFNGFTECVSIDCVALVNEEHFVSGCADGSLYVWSLGRKKPVFVRRRAHGCRPISHHSNGLASTKIAPIDGTPANGFAQIQRANIASCRQNAAEETGTQQPQQQPNESGTPAATSTAGKGSKRPDSDATKRTLGAEAGEPHWICSVATMPYTDLIATGSSDGFLRLWKIGPDWKTLDPVDQFSVPGFINDIRFSPDGRLIACAVGQEHKRGRWWTLRGPQGVQNRIVVIPLLGSQETTSNI